MLNGCEAVSVVLIYISLMLDDVEHLFICLFAILCVFFGDAHSSFLIGLLDFCGSNAIFIYFQKTELVNQDQILRR